MKGVIVVPTFYLKRHQGGIKSQRSKFLLQRLSQKYEMPLIYTDTPSLEGLDVALIYAVPYHNRPKIPQGLLETKVKLIGYFEDLQCWGNKECKRNKKRMFDKYDVLMGACWKSFRSFYPEHVHKYVHFPNFFFPHLVYTRMELNPRRKMRCLMAATVNRFYPFRMYIRQDRDKLIDVTKVPFKDYPQLLNNYFCAIAVPGRLRNVVAKYLEIPAAGTLMLAERVEELDVMGLRPYTHYVPITKENIFAQVKKCLTNPEKFIKIRDNGTKFVRGNHSIHNRVAQFGDILGRF